MQPRTKNGSQSRAISFRYWLQTGLLLSFFILSAATVVAGFQAESESGSAGYVFDLVVPQQALINIVKEVANDPVVQGTYVYEREKTLTGALPAASSTAFAPWQGPGTVFYKVRSNALSPRHFVNSNDLGTITVRYVVIPESATHTRVRIDAVFVENGRRKVHVSDGSIETAEYAAIQAGVEKYRRDLQEAAEAEKQRQDEVAKGILARQRQEEAERVATAEDSVRNLEMRLHDLQHELELQVRAGGADLKTAPFRAAAKMKSLPGGTQVVVLILTPYWYGVETNEGQRGWLRRDTVEPLP